MSEKTFIRGGLVFFFGTIVLICFSGEKVKKYDEGAARQAHLWRQTMPVKRGLAFMSETTAARHDERYALLRGVGCRELSEYDRGFLEWLRDDLELRPPEYRYDIECIRLLGRVKNYLKSLDSAGSCGIVEMLPEQTTQRENNAEPKRSRDTGERTMGQVD